jgi:hypothetical protein
LARTLSFQDTRIRAEYTHAWTCRANSCGERRIRCYRSRIAVEDYNRRAVTALARAQRLSQASSASAFARMIAARAAGAPSGTSYRRWINEEALIPAWALEAAAEVAGTTLPALLSYDTQLEDASTDWRAQMEDTIGRLQAEIIELRERVGLAEAPEGSTADAAPPRSVQQGANA